MLACAVAPLLQCTTLGSCALTPAASSSWRRRKYRWRRTPQQWGWTFGWWATTRAKRWGGRESVIQATEAWVELCPLPQHGCPMADLLASRACNPEVATSQATQRSRFCRSPSCRVRWHGWTAMHRTTAAAVSTTSTPSTCRQPQVSWLLLKACVCMNRSRHVPTAGSVYLHAPPTNPTAVSVHLCWHGTRKWPAW